jgi:BirA family transcriptional regulator, biotin operon repressor / biotin---[acetyl-CoA-carboxylase] ligase
MSALAEAVSPLLATGWLGRAWRHLPECGSTNDEAAAWARAGAPAGAVVTAEAQTKGRGRLGRQWHSPPGESLYLSVVLRPRLDPPRVPPLTLAAGVAVAEAVARFDVEPALKWPNDVLAGGKKLSGILTEMATRGMGIEHVVVGVGVNLNGAAFPPELQPIATSLRLQRGAPVDVAAFAATLCERLEVWIDRFVAEGPPAVTDAWVRFAPFFGGRVTVTAAAGPLAGIAEGLDPDGALRLRTDDGRTVRVIAGELT